MRCALMGRLLAMAKPGNCARAGRTTKCSSAWSMVALGAYTAPKARCPMGMRWYTGCIQYTTS